LEKPADKFVVLLTGGSVAAQFAQMNPNGPRYLELILNARYESPNGHPFLVLNGADGAWKQPQQTIIFLEYADAVHAVVTPDGFNEHYRVGTTLRFEYPASNFATVNPLATYDFQQVVGRWLLGKSVGLLSESPILSRSQAAYLLVAGLDKFMKSDPLARSGRRTTVKSLFALPPDWRQEKRIEWALGQYRKYIRAMNAVARDQGVLTAHFVQPAPAVGKKLSQEERAVVGDLSYREIYLRMTDDLLQLNKRGIPVFSMLEVFKDEQGTLYADHIHLLRSPSGQSRGYRLMAEFMAEHLAQAWGLRPRR